MVLSLAMFTNSPAGVMVGGGGGFFGVSSLPLIIVQDTKMAR